MIGCAGVGLHSGARVGLTLCPAAEGSGIRFRRVDRLGSAPIAASLDNVRGSDPATSLGHPAGGVRMIEHLMAAFAACEIDNVLVEISGPELPVMDGSALPFVLLMECAGAVEQAAPAAVLELVRPLTCQLGRWLGHARARQSFRIGRRDKPGPAPIRVPLLARWVQERTDRSARRMLSRRG